MYAGANAEEHVETKREHAPTKKRPALLASAPVRIWLMLLMATSSIAVVAALTDLIAAPELLRRIPLSLQIIVGAVSLSLFSFSIGAASARPLPGEEDGGDKSKKAGGAAPNGAATTDAAHPEDYTAFFEVDAPAARDALGAKGGAQRPAPPAAPVPPTGPRWLAWIDDRMTRPLSRTSILVAVTCTSCLSGYGAWHWFGGLGEALTVLLAVAILSGLFSRVSAMAARSRQAVDDLRTTNDRLVHEIASRRSQAASAAPNPKSWSSSIGFEDAKVHDIEALRTKFLNEVSHELRGPITAINLAARIIMKHHVYDHDVVERFGSTIVTEGDRLAHIVNDFLELAKIESGCVTWQQEQVNAEDVVNSAVYAVESLAAEREITLRAEIDDGLPALSIDRDRVVQAVTILAGNALRSARKGSTVTLHARRGHQESLFAVEQKGAAAAPKKVDIFKAAAGDAKAETRDETSNGHGLALCIASEIAAHYGGEMWIEGRTDSGSAVLISIPDSASRPSSETAADPSSATDENASAEPSASVDDATRHDRSTAADGGATASIGEKQPESALPLIGSAPYTRPATPASEPVGDSLSEYLGDDGFGDSEEAAYIAENTRDADADDQPRRDALATLLATEEKAGDAAAEAGDASSDDSSSFTAHFANHTTRVDAMSAASEAAASAYGDHDPFDPQTFFDAPYAAGSEDGRMPTFEEDLASMERYESMLEEVLGKDTELGKDFAALADDREYVDALNQSSPQLDVEPDADDGTDTESVSASDTEAAENGHTSMLTRVTSGLGFSLHKSSKRREEAEQAGSSSSAAADGDAADDDGGDHQDADLDADHDDGDADDRQTAPAALHTCADDAEDDQAGGDEAHDADDDDSTDEGSGGSSSEGGRATAPGEGRRDCFEPLSIAALPKRNDTPAMLTALAAGISNADPNGENRDGSARGSISAAMLAAVPGAKVRENAAPPAAPAGKGQPDDVAAAPDARPQDGGWHKQPGNR